MNCRQCGSPLTENDQFCKRCGTAVNVQSVSQSVNTQPQNNSMANENYGQSNYSNANQPTWTNSYGVQCPVPKKNDNTKFIIIGVIIVVLVAVIAIIIGMISSFGGNGNTDTPINNGTSNNGTSDINNSGNSGNTVTQTSFYKVNFNGFTVNIPDNLVYEQSGDVLVVGNEEDTWLAQIELIEGSYVQLKNNSGQMQQLLQKQGLTSSAAQIRNVGGVEFITLEVSSSGQNAIFAYAKANSMYVFAFTIFINC